MVGMERPELLACIEEPVAEPDPRQEEQQAEPVEAAILGPKHYQGYRVRGRQFLPLGVNTGHLSPGI